MLSLLADGARELGVELSKQQLDRFERYTQVLTDWAQRISLTTVRDSEGIQRRHYLESVALLPILDQEDFPLRDCSVIDVGSGTGVPGIPLKILEPSIRLTLVESKHRKVEFLNALLPDIGLEDVTVLHKRAEEVGRDPRHREQYDIAVAKALAPMSTLAELTLPLVRMGGIVVAPKGRGAEQEAKEAAVALETLKGSLRAVEPLPGAEPPQTVIIIDKDLPTPDRYPRRPGMPAKRPL